MQNWLCSPGFATNGRRQKTKSRPIPGLNARTTAEGRAALAIFRSAPVAGAIVLVVAAVGLAACTTRGDLGRARTDYISKNVIAPVDRHLLTGGKQEHSRLPQTDEERHMYDVLCRFFASPTTYDGPPFGLTKVRVLDLKSGAAFAKTDRYYAYLKRTRFDSSRAPYRAVTGHISADLGTIDAAFAAICAVEVLDKRRATAAGAIPELSEEERRQLDLRLDENDHVIGFFALALDYRYQSYSYALKRLLVETPNEAARDVDAKLSALAVKLDAAKQDTYCGPASAGAVTLGQADRN
jgi:hypothetical protein